MGFIVSYDSFAKTHHCRLDDVQVPVENLIGREGEGMKQIMVNLPLYSH
jgi:alkylation response protein AidB-like acyl-CoA dehydrogenase